MAETDRQLAANGITTAYHGLTLSWEPGLRSVEAGAAFLLAFDGLRQGFAVDHRIQLRWESFALEAVELVKTWLASPLRPALAFNDHTTGMLRKFAGGDVPKKAGEWAARAELPLEDYLRLVLSLAERESDVPAALGDLAATARRQGATLLSHDDCSREERQRFRDLGATVAEFPLVEEAAADARLNSEHVVLGAPNVVRGRSHIGALDATTAVGADLCTVLASDYYYPSMLRAAELLARGVGLAAVWPLVSRYPAAAMGLDDRGSITAGQRADLVVVRVENGRLSLCETFSAGVRVWQGGRVIAGVAAA
jgi:alpha-D-ribose 1-methylphosphonate 5-triphosphate diphosphatase